MKAIILLLGFALLMGTNAFAQGEYKTFTSPQHLYTIEIPASWDTSPSFNKRIDFQALSPVEPSDKVRENVNAVVYQLKAPSLDEFYQVAKASLAQSSEEWELIAEGESETADGSRMLYLINTHPNGQSKQEMKSLVYFYYKTGTGIILSCTAIPETFEAYRERFEQIAKSFRWNNE